MTVTPQNIQNDLIASMEFVDPMKKAMQSVSEVIVIEGPACCMPRLIRSEAGKFRGTWSMALQTTNMSSTPIPSIRTGKTDISSDPFQS